MAENSVAEKKAEHTPGPWRCEVGTMGSFVGNPADKRIAPHYVLNRSGNGAQIVHQDEAHANARLIAASPKLFALLHECADILDAYVDVNDGDDGRPVANRAAALRAEILAEIAKLEIRS